MPATLYPYNLYILYAAIVLLLLFLCFTIIKALSSLKEIKTLTNNTASMQVKLNQTKEKTETIQRRANELLKKTKWIFTALPILLAMQAIYKNNDDLEGIKGYSSAAKIYFKNTNEEKKLVKRLNKAMNVKK